MFLINFKVSLLKAEVLNFFDAPTSTSEQSYTFENKSKTNN